MARSSRAGSMPRALRFQSGRSRSGSCACTGVTKLTSKGSPPTEAPPMGAPERVPPSFSRSRGTPLATALPPPRSARRRLCRAPWRFSTRPKSSACARRVQFFQRDFVRFSRGAPRPPERFRASFWLHERRSRTPQPELDRRSWNPWAGRAELNALAWTRASCLSTIETTLSLTRFKHG